MKWDETKVKGVSKSIKSNLQRTGGVGESKNQSCSKWPQTYFGFGIFEIPRKFEECCICPHTSNQTNCRFHNNRQKDHMKGYNLNKHYSICRPLTSEAEILSQSIWSLSSTLPHNNSSGVCLKKFNAWEQKWIISGWHALKITFPNIFWRLCWRHGIWNE